jgi:outer membrane protein insertion porin family
MVEKGFNAEVTHSIAPVEGSAKTVNLTFHVTEGPKVKIRRVDFVGNSAVSDGTLQRQLKENKPSGILSWITGTGTFNAAKFEEDAERVQDYYQNRGYPNVRVGQPELRDLETTKDGETQWVELRIPVTEGARYRFGELDFTGNTRVPSDILRTLYDIEPGDYYSRKKIVDGNRKAQEIYGSRGFMEFNPFPMLSYSDQPDALQTALAAQVPDALAAPEAPENGTNGRGEPPTLDIAMQIDEGPQYFVNRIVFTGNTTTRDNVIRREMRLIEGGVFDSEALKYSIRRLNQLGYFAQLEGNERDMKVDKTPDRTRASSGSSRSRRPTSWVAARA